MDILKIGNANQDVAQLIPNQLPDEQSPDAVAFHGLINILCANIEGKGGDSSKLRAEIKSVFEEGYLGEMIRLEDSEKKVSESSFSRPKF